MGIAILDSGLDASHRSLQDANGRSRVRERVDFAAVSEGFPLAGWRKGDDLSALLAPLLSGTVQALTGTVSGLLSGNLLVPLQQLDPYGHGTHVASVAAGAGQYQSPDSSGLAPGADLYDVRVLDERGVGRTGRRAGRHRLGDAARQGAGHPRDEPEPGHPVDRLGAGGTPWPAPPAARWPAAWWWWPRRATSAASTPTCACSAR